VMAFVGSPGLITGRLAARLNLTSIGTDVSNVIDRARGTARVDLEDGTVKNLGLVRAVVLATSMRAGTQAAPETASSDERFSTLGATLAIADGRARTSDLHFESSDVTFRAAGSVRIDGAAIGLNGTMQLSDALSQRAGRDLFRYTQEGGRVTIPATVTGSARSPVARIDIGGVAARAAKNRIQEEVGKAMKKAIDDLFKR
jgi:uncharacterized protein involved in outer membrane biogenesis